jgi:TonB family protein
MAQLEGTVTVVIEIGSDGRVISAKASGPSKLLERASEENARHWTFSGPPTRLGSGSRQTKITYVYKLEGKPQYYDPPPTVVLDLPERVEITSQPPEPQPAVARPTAAEW